MNLSDLSINPNTITKEKLKETSFELLTEFILNNNDIETPKICIKKINAAGYYIIKSKIIEINNITTSPVKTPGYKWSFPGYKADMTFMGILCHEFGHHIYYTKKIKSKEYKLYLEKEINVSSYEPNIDEKFAEAFKLFLTNPDLLKKGRPKRYNFITKELGINHFHNISWNNILHFAHPKIHVAAKNWINKNVNISFAIL